VIYSPVDAACESCHGPARNRPPPATSSERGS
jgi:hypothetical protein